MPDKLPPLPPDLSRLRTLRTYLKLQLDAVTERIRELEEQQRAVGYRLQHLRGGNGGQGRGVLHRAGCWITDGAVLSHSEALIAMEEPSVTLCEACRPQPQQPHRPGALPLPGSTPYRMTAWAMMAG